MLISTYSTTCADIICVSLKNFQLPSQLLVYMFVPILQKQRAISMLFKDVTYLGFILFLLMELFIGVLWSCNRLRNSNTLRY